MSDEEYTTKDAVNFAADGNAHDFKKAVNDLLMDRIRDAVDLKKVDVAANFLSPEVEDSEEDFEEPETVEGDYYDDQEV